MANRTALQLLRLRITLITLDKKRRFLLGTLWSNKTLHFTRVYNLQNKGGNCISLPQRRDKHACTGKQIFWRDALQSHSSEASTWRSEQHKLSRRLPTSVHLTLSFLSLSRHCVTPSATKPRRNDDRTGRRRRRGYRPFG